MKSLKMTTSNGAAAAMIPAVGHTQRATIDCERNEIHVMTVSNEVEIYFTVEQNIVRVHRKHKPNM